jgi:hypothetical protein
VETRGAPPSMCSSETAVADCPTRSEASAVISLIGTRKGYLRRAEQPVAHARILIRCAQSDADPQATPRETERETDALAARIAVLRDDAPHEQTDHASDNETVQNNVQDHVWNHFAPRKDLAGTAAGCFRPRLAGTVPAQFDPNREICHNPGAQPAGTGAPTRPAVARAAMRLCVRTARWRRPAPRPAAVGHRRR